MCKKNSIKYNFCKLQYVSDILMPQWPYFMYMCWWILPIYRISGIFRVGLIFDEFATSLKPPKIDTGKNKLYIFIESHWNSENRTRWKFNTVTFESSFSPKFPDVKNSRYRVSYRAETIHRGSDFVRFVLLGSEFDSFSVFSVRSVSIFSHTYARS